jgi:hypothetical protein
MYGNPESIVAARPCYGSGSINHIGSPSFSVTVEWSATRKLWQKSRWVLINAVTGNVDTSKADCLVWRPIGGEAKGKNQVGRSGQESLRKIGGIQAAPTAP